MPWSPIDNRRIGGVSAFGFSGTNAHIVVEEALGETLPPPAALDERAGPLAHLFVLSARDAVALSVHARRFAAAVSGYVERDLPNLCHTANFGRSHFAERATVVARTIGEISERLEALARGEDEIGRASCRERVCELV